MNYIEENNNLILKFRRFRKKNKDMYIRDFIQNLNNNFYRCKIGRLKLRSRYMICVPLDYGVEWTMFIIRDGKFKSLIDGIDMSKLLLSILIYGEEDKV